MPHYLNVYELGGGKFDRWIDHEDDCPTEIRDFDEETGDHWHAYTCSVGYWEEMYGYEDLQDDERFTTAGRYKIDFYNEKVFQSEEWDSFLFFVGEDF